MQMLSCLPHVFKQEKSEKSLQTGLEPLPLGQRILGIDGPYGDLCEPQIMALDFTTDLGADLVVIGRDPDLLRCGA